MKKSEKLDIGHLHNMHKYRKGYYVYIGSAMNSLVPRLNRHLSDEKKMHWHIDYLLKSPDCHIRDILFNISEERIECDLAESISKDGEEIPGFGCSDCATLQNPYQKTERKFQALDAQTVAAVHI